MDTTLVDDLLPASRHASDAELLEALPGVLRAHGLPETVFDAVMMRRRIERKERMRELQRAYDNAIAAAVANA
jgi:hypothetical protein